MNRETWAQAACRGHDPETWFPIGNGETARQQTAAAIAICGTCPIRQQCLDTALDLGVEYGVWGGVSEQELQAMRAERRQPQQQQRPLAPCGTYPAWKRHRYYREPACADCLAAKNAYERERESRVTQAQEVAA